MCQDARSVDSFRQRLWSANSPSTSHRLTSGGRALTHHQHQSKASSKADPTANTCPQNTTIPRNKFEPKCRSSNLQISYHVVIHRWLGGELLRDACIRQQRSSPGGAIQRQVDVALADATALTNLTNFERYGKTDHIMRAHEEWTLAVSQDALLSRRAKKTPVARKCTKFRTSCGNPCRSCTFTVVCAYLCRCSREIATATIPLHMAMLLKYSTKKRQSYSSAYDSGGTLGEHVLPPTSDFVKRTGNTMHVALGDGSQWDEATFLSQRAQKKQSTTGTAAQKTGLYMHDNDNDTLRKVPHPSNEGLALQARVTGS